MKNEISEIFKSINSFEGAEKEKIFPKKLFLVHVDRFSKNRKV